MVIGALDNVFWPHRSFISVAIFFFVVWRKLGMFGFSDMDANSVSKLNKEV